jgi:hypothetical protein
VVCAWARLAMKRWTAAGMLRSRVVTMSQLGLVFQAAVVAFSSEGGLGDGTLLGGHQGGLLGGHVSGELVTELVLLDVQVGGGGAVGLLVGDRIEGVGEGGARVLVRQLQGALAGGGQEGGHVDQALDLGVVRGGLADDVAAVGVADEDLGP